LGGLGGDQANRATGERNRQGQLRPKYSMQAATTTFVKLELEPRTSANLSMEGVLIIS